MRLLVLNWRDWEHPWAGGAETFLRETVTRLVDHGHQVTLLCQQGPGQTERAIMDGVTIIRYGKGLMHSVLSPLWVLRNQNRFDLVWEFTNKLPYGGPLFVRRPLVGAAMHVNGSTASKELGLIGVAFQAIEHTLYRLYRSTPFVAISESTREELAELGVDTDDVAVVHCGISDDYLRTPQGPKSFHPTVICVSRLKRYKRIDLLIRAMAGVAREVPEVRLTIVGTGDQEETLKSLVRELGLEEQIRFAGHVDEETKRVLLDESWIQVQPSMKEGWGLTVIEAGARGVPTVAFDVPGLRDSIQHGVTGCLINQPSADLLSDELGRLLADHPRREALGRKAREWAAYFSWDRTSQRLERVFVHASGVPARTLQLGEIA